MCRGSESLYQDSDLEMDLDLRTVDLDSDLLVVDLLQVRLLRSGDTRDQVAKLSVIESKF